jgi:multidrug efflux pump
MSRFFIDRPVFAWVIALIIMLVGGIAVLTLPVAELPSIAPPPITISVTYPGAGIHVLQRPGGWVDADRADVRAGH